MSNQDSKSPKIGVGTITYNKDNKILLGKRMGAHGQGYWSTAGGHLHFGESIEDCVKREVFEETGLVPKKITPLGHTNDIFKEENLHYVTIFNGVLLEGEPINKEPHKCEGWEWFDFDNLPSPLFLPVENLLKQKTIKELLFA